jgi:hypothetical protein
MYILNKLPPCEQKLITAAWGTKGFTSEKSETSTTQVGGGGVHFGSLSGSATSRNDLLPTLFLILLALAWSLIVVELHVVE